MKGTTPEPDDELESERPSFVMVPNWLVEANPSPVALAAYVRLRHRADWASGRVAFSLAQLAAELGYAKRDTVRPYLEELVALGALDVREQHGTNGAQLRNLYVVRLTPARSSGHPLPRAAGTPCPVQRAASTDPLCSDPLSTDTSEPSSDAPLEIEVEQTRADVEAICERMRDRLLSNGARKTTAAITKTWRTEARRLLDVDRIPLPIVLETLEFATTDSFWRRNVLGVPALRRHWDKLRMAIPTDGPGARPEPTPAQRAARPIRSWEDESRRKTTAWEFLSRGLDPELWDDVDARPQLRERVGAMRVEHDEQTTRILYYAWKARSPIDLEVPGWRRELV